MRMFVESRREFLLRWYLYRWRKNNRPWVRAEFAFYRAMWRSPKDGLFLDLGANVGVMTAQALGLGKQVIAFEPDPDALQQLNARFGSHPDVQIIPKAVGVKAGTATLYQKADGNTKWSSLDDRPELDGAAHTVEVVDIVAFIKHLDRPVSVLKMDIEGSEIECLNAILDAGLHKEMGTLLVETHERFSAELAEKTAKLRKRVADERARNIDLDWI